LCISEELGVLWRILGVEGRAEGGNEGKKGRKEGRKEEWEYGRMCRTNTVTLIVH
jgi:hypothetical protein